MEIFPNFGNLPYLCKALKMNGRESGIICVAASSRSSLGQLFSLASSSPRALFESNGVQILPPISKDLSPASLGLRSFDGRESGIVRVASLWPTSSFASGSLRVERRSNPSTDIKRPQPRFAGAEVF